MKNKSIKRLFPSSKMFGDLEMVIIINTLHFNMYKEINDCVS